MSALSRTKGASFERKVANMLTEATGAKWRRRVRNHDGDSDVIADNPAYAHISVECKHAAQLRLPQWWRQAQAQAGQGIPVLVYKASGTVGEKVMLDAFHVNPSHWPVPGRYTITLDWDVAMQWLREKLPSAYSPEVI